MTKSIASGSGVLLLLTALAFAQTVTSPVDSVLNIVDSKTKRTWIVWPLVEAAGALVQVEPPSTDINVVVGTSGTQVLTTFKASATPYTLVGVRVGFVLEGPGYYMTDCPPQTPPAPCPKPFQIDKPLPPLSVPAGSPVEITYNTPLSGDGSVIASIGDTRAPNAPTGLTAVQAGATGATLAWTASWDNVGVASYAIERCTSLVCTAFTKVGTSAVTLYGDQGLASAQSYSYRVQALDLVGNRSAYSNIAVMTTPVPPPPPPSPPTGPVFTSLAKDSFAGTALGPAWAVSPGEQPFKVVAGAAMPSSVTADCGARYVGAAIPAGQYSRGNLFVSGTGGNRQGIGFVLRQQAGARTNYRFVIDHAGTNNASITKRVAGAGQALAIWTMPFVDGDQVTFAISDKGVLYVFDKAGATVRTFDDSAAQIIGGTVGIDFSSNEISAAIRNWEGGAFSP